MWLERNPLMSSVTRPAQGSGDWEMACQTSDGCLQIYVDTSRPSNFDTQARLRHAVCLLRYVIQQARHKSATGTATVPDKRATQMRLLALKIHSYFDSQVRHAGCDM